MVKRSDHENKESHKKRRSLRIRKREFLDKNFKKIPWFQDLYYNNLLILFSYDKIINDQKYMIIEYN